MTKNEWLAPYEKTLSPRDAALLSEAYDVLSENTFCGDYPWGNARVISPWRGRNAGIWNWDSVFHAMTVCRFDGALAKSCIDTFAAFQKADGMLPDVIYHNGVFEDNYSKPPVFAFGVLRVYERTGDRDFLARNYARAVRYEGFWRRDRFDRGLFFYAAQEHPEKDDYLHPRWESGWDNSPRWDVWPIVELWPIDLNCYMVLYYRALGEMAALLGDDASVWHAREESLVRAIEENLFDGQTGAYLDRNRKTGAFSPKLSPASFMPLFVKIAPRERAAAMAKLATDREKFYPGMPTIAYDDAGYDGDYWRGPTWLNVAFFAIKGLYQYGYTDTANEMRTYLLDLAHRHLPNIHENYDTKKGVGCSCARFSWSACFLIEFILDWEK